MNSYDLGIVAANGKVTRAEEAVKDLADYIKADQMYPAAFLHIVHLHFELEVHGDVPTIPTYNYDMSATPKGVITLSFRAVPAKV